MSNSRAIAAVTATLRSLLEKGTSSNPADPNSDDALGEVEVTTRPLDEARKANGNKNQVNLFLYEVLPNSAYRNLDLPRQVRPGETGQPPLALNLYYLLTVYADDNEAPLSHRLLGRAMSILHDHPVLGRAEIDGALAGSDVGAQFERVRLALQPLTNEEIFKLWSGFQTQYRLSVSYEATVVLIDSTRPSVTPLPVLTRGPADEGPTAQAGLTAPLIERVDLPKRQTGARLGDTVTLIGEHLSDDTGATSLLRFSNLRLLGPLTISAQPDEGATKITAQLKINPATDPTVWVAGFYTVAALVKRGGKVWASNEAPFSIAPRIDAIVPAVAPRDAANAVVIEVTCTPEVRPEQRVVLLLTPFSQLQEPREVPVTPLLAPASKLTFKIDAAEKGDFWVRVRVDGADSLLIDEQFAGAGFDPAFKLTII